jgi:hypothetical protein
MKKDTPHAPTTEPIIEIDTILPFGIFYLDRNGIISKYDPVYKTVLPKCVLRQNFFDMLASRAAPPFDYEDFLKKGISHSVETVDGVRVTFLRVSDLLCIVLCSPLPTKEQSSLELTLLEPMFCIRDGHLVVVYEKGGDR